MVNIRTKGARGEREIKDAFVSVMERVEARMQLAGVSEMVKRNTLQSDRGGDDIVGIPLLSIEVKRQETVAINTWWQQCVKSANAQKLMPVLIYRQTRQKWNVVTYLVNGHPKFKARQWVRAEISLADFLDWYDQIYAEWLNGEQAND